MSSHNWNMPNSAWRNHAFQSREDRERRDRERAAAEEAEQELEWDYERYRDSEVDRHIAANPEAFEALKEAKWNEDRERFSFSTESMARDEARREIRRQLTFLTLEEFVARKRHGTDFSLKPVAPSPVSALPPTPEIPGLVIMLAPTTNADQESPLAIAAIEERTPEKEPPDEIVAAEPVDQLAVNPPLPPDPQGGNHPEGTFA
jgi:hypothetical protein